MDPIDPVDPTDKEDPTDKDKPADKEDPKDQGKSDKDLASTGFSGTVAAIAVIVLLGAGALVLSPGLRRHRKL